MVNKNKDGEKARRLASLVAAFKQTFSMTLTGIEALAGIYKDALRLDPDFGQRLRDNGVHVSDAFLASLLKVANKELYAGLLLQHRGLARLRKLTYEEQKQLCTTGVMLYMPGHKSQAERIPLCDMTNEQVVMAVTTQGRLRSVQEQLEWHNTPPKRSGGHGALCRHTPEGIIFYTRKVWSIVALEEHIREWKRVYQDKGGK